MYLSVNNGRVIFATHIIKAEKLPYELPFQVESEGVICYSENETEKAKVFLDKAKVKYTIELIITDSKLKDTAQGVKYKSRSEAISHLQEKIEPESTFLPNLVKRLEKAEAENKKIPALLQRIEAAESKLNMQERSV